MSLANCSRAIVIAVQTAGVTWFDVLWACKSTALMVANLFTDEDNALVESTGSALTTISLIEECSGDNLSCIIALAGFADKILEDSESTQQDMSESIDEAEAELSGDPSEPRFTDMGDGTVRDNNTNLIWLKDSNAFGSMIWGDAMTEAANLSNEEHGLTDGSVDGDWRLPTKEEWEAFVDMGYWGPALCNTAGDGQWTEGNAFIGIVVAARYWSSTEHYDSIMHAYYMDMRFGLTNTYSKSYNSYVWPVRSDN